MEDHTSNDDIVAKILEKTGFDARHFQVEATKAILEGHDVVVHAGTGSGKTLIFTAPHFVLEHKVSLVISPLILLQHDQENRIRQMGLSAIAINNEAHLEAEVWTGIAQGKYEIILLSPEMALHSEQVQAVFASPAFQQALIAIHVDEAHTISLWGGGFRKDYKGLGRIRARLPKGVPATIVSATLRPNVKNDAMATLGFPSNPSEYVDINIGNERTNVYIGARAMKYPASSFKDLSPLIDPDETNASQIPKTIIYIDDVIEVTLAVITLNGWLHGSLQEQGLIMPVHAWMPSWYRSEAMARFASGEVRILICTEAAGMGCDIPDIERIIQLGICQSIDAFMQRIGRAWRGSNGKGEGWLIFEPWVRNEQSGGAGQTKRKCDPILRGLVVESKCRRSYLNKVYKNPPSGESKPQNAYQVLIGTLL
ncbi:DEAD/DEAH-box helicase [Rhizoctonia solani AG-3 Rhs1AP]|uniref:DNA 3'-5' helicase n=2 Tax=Rhizoctonia solani AG-3 TaxID=1086053 RepID=A0A074S287_9AGAM|nr:DEAD/DEAH-box helicase [Rhizoctonia solani AG-3 Rhs1AP]KEP51665.1 DEAD/DEAH-box helicase [Rhizoctonia solani 123E]